MPLPTAKTALAPELILLVCLALGQAVDVGFVQGVDFVLVVALLREHPRTELEQFGVTVSDGQLARQLAHEPAGDGPEAARGLAGELAGAASRAGPATASAR